MKPAPALGQDFSIEDGDQVNWFLSAGDASSHTIVTGARNPRLLFTYPDGNIGTAVWFDPRHNRGLSLRFIEPPHAVESNDGEGVDARVATNRNRIVITDCALDSVRVLRGHKTEEGGDLGPSEARAWRARYAKKHCVPVSWVAETWHTRGNHLTVERSSLDKQKFQLTFDLPNDARVRQTEDGICISRKGGEPLSFGVHSRIPIALMHRFAPEFLFRPAVLDTLKHLHAAADAEGAPRTIKRDRDAFVGALRGLMFLAREEKFMAGAWRFMTYFGRDTMISLMLAHDALTPRAFRDGLQSVLDRLSRKGSVAHEEDVGPFAELRHVMDPLLPGAVHDPVHDYKMIDDDFLLSIMAGMYLNDESLSMAERRAFLSHKGPDKLTNMQKLLANWNLIVERTQRWAHAHGLDHRSLVGLNVGSSVGNWRDSNSGLGGGIYPVDVNVDLAPCALESMRRIMRSGLVSPDDIRCASARLPHLSNLEHLDRIEARWKQVPEMFNVMLDAGAVRQRLGAFLKDGPLGTEERAYFLRTRFADGTTLQSFLEGKIPRDLRTPLHFSALSLDAKGHPIPIMNSDFGFRLFFGRPSPAEVSEMLRLIELPYPVGLMTPLGPVTANAGYSSSPVHWRSLSRDSYHGAVIWSWQLSLMESGLMRQFNRFRKDPTQGALTRRLEAGVQRLIDARRHVGALSASELWTYEVRHGHMKPLAFGQRSGSETESNAIQLWSCIFPALFLKEQALHSGTET